MKCGKLSPDYYSYKQGLNVIELQNVSKRYYNIKAIDSLSLTVREGEVLGILGPNGAGKTTLFKLIAGLLQPDNGRLRPTAAEWPSIGYKPERLLFPNHLRIKAYLETVAGLSDMPRARANKAVQDSLEWVGLTDVADKKIKDSSKGMRQRLGLAQVLIGNPSLLLLDEPSNGLDPAGQSDILTRIKQLQAAGKTILISSHQLHEMTQVCTRLIIIKDGRIRYQENMQAAMDMSAHVLIHTDKNTASLAPFLHQMHADISTHGHTVRLDEGAFPLRRQIMMILLRSGCDILRVEHKTRTLSEIYAEAVR